MVPTRRPKRLVRNINPADPDDVIAEFPSATADGCRSAIDRRASGVSPLAKDARPGARPRLWRAADIARHRADEIARTLTREEGKILKEAKGEVMKGISLLGILRRRRLSHARQDTTVRSARHLYLHDAPAVRRRRFDRAVEFSLGHSGMENRPGIGRRQLP